MKVRGKRRRRHGRKERSRRRHGRKDKGRRGMEVRGKRGRRHGRKDNGRRGMEERAREKEDMEERLRVEEAWKNVGKE